MSHAKRSLVFLTSINLAAIILGDAVETGRTLVVVLAATLVITLNAWYVGENVAQQRLSDHGAPAT